MSVNTGFVNTELEINSVTDVTHKDLSCVAAPHQVQC